MYELNNREICGERVTIEHAKGTPRSGGGGGYRGSYGRRDSYRLILALHHFSLSEDGWTKLT